MDVSLTAFLFFCWSGLLSSKLFLVSTGFKANCDMAEKDYRKRHTHGNCCTPQNHSFAHKKQKHCLKYG